MKSQEENFDISILCEQGVITDSEKNLRSKIESISRSLEQLANKKLRIDFEIKKQKKVLTRKREELKRVSTRNQVKLSTTLETLECDPQAAVNYVAELRKYDHKLLQKSNQALEL